MTTENVKTSRGRGAYGAKRPEGSYLFYELKCFSMRENGIEAGGLARQESKSLISSH